MTVILGIDGSLTATGWTRVEVRKHPLVIDENCIRTAPHRGPARIYAADDLGRRVDEIVAVLNTQIPRAHYLAVEAPAGSQNSKAAQALALVYGAVRALAYAHSTPVIVVQSGDCKRITCGHRNASKADVQAWAESWGSLAGNAVEREAVADARAVVRAALESPVLRGGAV